MPILDLPRSFRRLGKIRLGEQVPVMEGDKQKLSKTGAPVFRPAKLQRFRLTSPDKDLLDHAAEVYGGEVREWAGAPGDGDQWELYVEARALDVVVPPQHQSEGGDLESGSFQQWYELWSGGGCQRRCDGVTEHISGKPCSAQSPACPADHEARRAAAANGKACKMTTRVMVILPKLPDLGVWMIESHGWYAAVELGGFMEFLARRAPGQFVEAHLEPEARSVKRAGKTHNFVVPVIKLPQGTAGELLAGTPAPQAIGTGQPGQRDQGIVSDSERVRTFVIACSDKGWDDDTRHAIVGYATKGRTRSSREVGVDEWPAVEAVVRWFSDGKLVLDRDDTFGAFLRKPESGDAARPTGQPIAVASREVTADLPGADPRTGDELEYPSEERPPDDEQDEQADDWDRTAMVNRLARLDAEHQEIAKARMDAAGLPGPDEPMTKAEDDEANNLILKVEEEARAVYAERRKRAVGAMKAVGVTSADAQAELVAASCEPGVNVKRLSDVAFEAVMAACDALAASDAEAEQAAS